jgi:hypothetical protein
MPGVSQAGSAGQENHLGHEAGEEDERHRREDQGQPQVAFLLFGCRHGNTDEFNQPITRVAEASSLGGVS